MVCLDVLMTENMMPENETVAGFPVTLGVDVNKLPQPHTIKKTMDEETKAKVREENVKIRESLES